MTVLGVVTTGSLTRFYGNEFVQSFVMCLKEDVVVVVTRWVRVLVKVRVKIVGCRLRGKVQEIIAKRIMSIIHMS